MLYQVSYPHSRALYQVFNLVLVSSVGGVWLGPTLYPHSITKMVITFSRRLGIVIRKNRWKVDFRRFLYIYYLKYDSIRGERYASSKLDFLYKYFTFSAPFCMKSRISLIVLENERMPTITIK